MKLKKQLASLAVMGMMSLVAASSAFASGVGYVNFDTLVQSHKDFPKVSAQMQAAVKDANEQFAKKAPKMKTDQERQNLGRELAQNAVGLVEADQVGDGGHGGQGGGWSGACAALGHRCQRPAWFASGITPLPISRARA